MTVLRTMVGFTFFHLAFWLRSQDSGTLWFGAVVGVSALASMVGNAIASPLRSRIREETMLTISLFVCAGAGLLVAALGGPIGAVVLAAVLNLMAALGRLSFESIVQRDAPGANRGRAFAVFETRFQLAWAMGAFVAVAIQVPGQIGFLIVAAGAVGAIIYLIGQRKAAATSSDGSGRQVSRRTRGRARGRAPRSRSASARPQDR
jgi:MFS family permease